VSEDPSLGRFVPGRRVHAVAVDALGDLLALHAEAGIELRIAPGLLAVWDAVVASTLDFSGIRLRNATLAS
jgi:Family of unknown function (DUF6886)